MNAADLISKVCEKYSTCTSYRDRGVLRTSVECWGEIHFETFYSAPKNLLVRFVYGPQDKPIQTETYWSNGTEQFVHTSGTVEKCEKLSGQSEFFNFGLRSLFEFEVPSLLIPSAQEFGGWLAKCTELIEEISDSSHHVLSYRRNIGAELYNTVFQAAIAKDNYQLKRVKTGQSFSCAPDIAAQDLIFQQGKISPIKNWTQGSVEAFAPKLLLIMGKPNVFPMKEVSTECIYHEVHFNEEIPEALFDFRPTAGAL